MKTLNLVSLVAASLLITACGAKSDGITVPNGDGGSTTITDSGGTGKITITKGIVATSKCKTTVLKGEDADITVIEYVGSSGSIDAPCDSDDYTLKKGVTNLNLKGVVVENFYYCKNKSGKPIAAWKFKHDLGKGKSITSWSSSSAGSFLTCTGDFASPLPKTVSSNDDIQDLVNYWDKNNFKNNNCTIGTGNDSADETCDGGWSLGANVTFIDDHGKVHKTTRKTNWVTSKH